MRHDPLPPFESEAELAELPFPAVDALLRAEAAEHGYPLHEGHGRSTWMRILDDEIGARRGPEGTILYVRSHARDRLYGLQEAVTAHVAYHMPGVEPQWSSIDKPGAYPPNFSLARVESVTRISSDFLRLRLTGEDLARFGRELIHFRLALQPAGTDTPAWPVIGPQGQTLWPKGAAALHRPAYTTRAVDHDGHWLDIDIYEHHGGRTCGFAASAEAGMQVGLTGPGGGGVATGPLLFLAGDETAYPALSRIIEARAADATGQVFMLGKNPDYPMPRRDGFDLHHLPQGNEALVRHLRDNPPAADCHIWIAARKSTIATLRKLLIDEQNRPRALVTLAAYWTEGGER